MELRAKTSDAPNGENLETATDYESLQNGNDRVSSGMAEYSVSRENKQTQQNTTPWGVKGKVNLNNWMPFKGAIKLLGTTYLHNWTRIT